MMPNTPLLSGKASGRHQQCSSNGTSVRKGRSPHSCRATALLMRRGRDMSAEGKECKI